MMRPEAVMSRVRNTLETMSTGGPFRTATTAGTLLVVFCIPWHNALDSFPSATKAVGGGVIALGAVAVLADGRRWRLSEVQVLGTVFLGLAASSMVWTINKNATLTYGFIAVQMAALLLLLWEFCPGTNGARWIARAWTAGCGVVVIDALVAHFSGAKPIDGRLALGSANPNDLGFMLCIGIPLAWYLSYHAANRWTQTLYRLYVPAALYAIVLLASRSGLVVGLLGALLIPWTYVSGNPRRFAVVAAAICLGLLVVPGLLPTEQAARLQTTTTELEGGTLNGRTELWSAAWATFAEHPFVGVGAGASRTAIYWRTGYQLRAHNTPLSIASELGAVGLAVFGLLTVVLVRAVMAAKGLDRRTATILGLVVVVGLQVRHWDYEQGTWFAIALLAALCITPIRVGGAAALERGGRALARRPGR